MAAPREEVKVRFTAEGAPEILASFNNIRAASRKLKTDAVPDFLAFGNALSNIRGLLGAIGIASAGAGFLAMAEHAATATGNAVRLANVLGTTVDKIEGLSVAARITNTDLMGSSRALASFITGTTAAAHGAGNLVKPLQALGLSQKEIQKLGDQDFAERLDVVAKKLAAMPVGATRSTLALEILSARGLKLLPIMNELGVKGLDGLRQRAHELGLTLDKDVAAQVAQMNKDFRELKLVAEGVATQFVAGFAPSMRQAIHAVDESMKDTAEGWKAIGEVIGFPFKVLIGVLTDLGVTFGGLLASIMHSSEALWQGIAHLIKGDVKGAADVVDSEMTKAIDAIKKANTRGAAVWKALFTPPPAIKKVPETEAPDLEGLFGERLARERAHLEAELALSKVYAKYAGDVEARRFEEGITSVREYYDARRTIVRDAAAEELKVLRERLALERQNPDAAAGAEAASKTLGELQKKEIELHNEIEGLNLDERKAVRAAASERIELDKRIATLRGDQHKAALLDIEEQIKKQKLLLAQGGPDAGDAASRAKALEDLRQALTLQAQFNEAARQANLTIGAFGRDRAAVDRLASAGLVSQADAERRVLALEKARLPVLRAQAEAMARIAADSTDPERVAQAESFAAAVDDIAVAVDAADNDMRKFGASVIDATQANLADFFQNGIRAGMEFGQIMGGLALSIEQSVQRILSQMLALKIVTGLLNLAGSIKAPGAPTGSVEPRQFTSPPAALPSFAEGGVVPGADLGFDSQTVAVRGGEFIVRPEVVQRPGILPALAALNRGLAPISVPTYTRRYAEGGLVPQIASDGGGTTGLMVGLEEGLVMRHIESPAGQKVIVRTVGKNAQAVRQVIPRG